MASRNAGGVDGAIVSGATAVKAPSMASSGRWSIQLMTITPPPCVPRQARIGDIVRIKPGVVDPAVLVVVGHALLGERRHLVEMPVARALPQRLDADVLVVAGVVALVELVASAELGADRIPQELHHLDALLVVDAVASRAHSAQDSGRSPDF